MPITIGTNIASFRARRSLDASSLELSKVFERLSSGQRINKASDDAAGLSMSEILNADARVFSQGVRNLNDGISMLNIADAAYNALGGILGRLTELSEQAANGVYSSKQREALNNEALQLNNEYNRIISTTEFNNIAIFGSNVSLQAGYGESGIFKLEINAQSTPSYDVEFSQLSSINTIGGPRDLALADFNNDNIIDFTYTRGASTFYFSLGNGDGTFGAQSSLNGATNSQNISTGDFDNDSHQDVLTVENGRGYIRWGEGDGNFTSTTFINHAGTGGREAAIGDLDGDGNQDYVATLSNSSGISIALGTGPRTFAASSFTSLGGGGRAIELADFNNDGNLDIAATNGGIALFLGNGDGTFGARVNYSVGSGPVDLVTGDFNGDGNIDIAASENSNGAVSVLLGNGDGTFSNKISYSVNSNPEELEVVDINEDGNLDLVATSSTSNSISILYGNSNGNFDPAENIDIGVTSNKIAIGDINGDNKKDILIASTANGSLIPLLSSITEINTRTNGLEHQSITTQESASQAIDYYSAVADSLSINRGKIASFQTRLESAIKTNQISVDNYLAAESRIRSVDIANESSKLVANQILQETATAVLAQANLQPSIALKLLR